MNLLADIRSTPATHAIAAGTGRKYAGGILDQARAALADPATDGTGMLIACATIYAGSDDEEERCEAMALLLEGEEDGDVHP